MQKAFQVVAAVALLQTKKQNNTRSLIKRSHQSRRPVRTPDLPLRSQPPKQTCCHCHRKTRANQCGLLPGIARKSSLSRSRGEDPRVESADAAAAELRVTNATGAADIAAALTHARKTVATGAAGAAATAIVAIITPVHNTVNRSKRGGTMRSSGGTRLSILSIKRSGGTWLSIISIKRSGGTGLSILGISKGVTGLVKDAMPADDIVSAQPSQS